ncbi:MAG TPA: hypothetical protein VK779_06340 [Rhizomicrobium sp.]|nr:hypothetical protein [Rhizomicrobium sp.]
MPNHFNLPFASREDMRDPRGLTQREAYSPMRIDSLFSREREKPCGPGGLPGLLLKITAERFQGSLWKELREMHVCFDSLSVITRLVRVIQFVPAQKKLDCPDPSQKSSGPDNDGFIL